MKQIIILLFLCFSFNVFANDIVEVEVEATGISKKTAVKEALRLAVEKAAGVNIDANTVLVNNRLVGDKTVMYSGGYVEKYEILSETVKDNQITVKIKAVVNLDTVSNENEAPDNSVPLSYKENKDMEKNNFAAYMSAALPKYKKRFIDTISLKPENLEKDLSDGFCKLSFQITPSVNKSLYDSIANNFIKFISDAGLKHRTADYNMIIEKSNGEKVIFGLNKEQFNVVKKNIYDDELSNLNIIILNKKGKMADCFKIANIDIMIAEQGENSLNISANIGNDTIISTIYPTKNTINSASSLKTYLGKTNDKGYFLGINVSMSSAELKINNIAPDSPASRYDLKQGDIIKSINGEKAEINTLKDIVYGSHKINIELIRDGKTTVKEIILTRRLNYTGNEI